MKEILTASGRQLMLGMPRWAETVAARATRARTEKRISRFSTKNEVC